MRAGAGPWHIRSEVRSSAHRFPIEQALLEGRPPIKTPIFWAKFRSRIDQEPIDWRSSTFMFDPTPYRRAGFASFQHFNK